MAAAAGAPTVHKTCDQLVCQIQRYDCIGLRAKKGDVNRLADTADAQKGLFDPRVLPWEDRCGPGIHRHYVAKSRRMGDETICGWMSVTVSKRKWNGRLYVYAYINKISTRRRQSSDDPYYGGVGKCLHDRLVADLQTERFDFIFLKPIDAVATAVYVKWGYIHPAHFADRVQEMFFMLRPELPQPPQELLESIRIPHDATVRNEAWQIINGRAIFGGEDGPPADDLIELFRKTHRDLDIGAITEAIDLIAVYEGDGSMSMEDQQELMRQAFAVKRGGRRKTRRRRRRHPRTKRFIV